MRERGFGLVCLPLAGQPDIFEEIVRLRAEGIPAALATIVGTRGSTPGRATMRLLVLADGTFLGTVGGGCLEAEVYDAALEVLAEEKPQSLQFRLTEKDSPDSGLMCGGEVTIFVEPITTPVLWIFGGGHVSKALCQVAALAGSSKGWTDAAGAAAENGFAAAKAEEEKHTRYPPRPGTTLRPGVLQVVAELIAVRRLGHDLQDSWAERGGQKARAEGVRDLPQAGD